MLKINWQTFLGLVFISISVALYGLHYTIFHDLHHIILYLVGDLAFLPIEVLLVTVLIHELLNQREKKVRLEKTTMVIGAFFSELGFHLLKTFAAIDTGIETIKEKMQISTSWTDQDFKNGIEAFASHDYSIDINQTNISDMKDFLLSKRDFTLRLIENPTILEHEIFTDLLWAVFHLTEELMLRETLTSLPKTDYKHLEVDIKRAYINLGIQWLMYMKYLQKSYPYLFSLSVRTNPLNSRASAIVME